jgi:hypothetical protein
LRHKRTAAIGLKAPRSINVYACCTACGGLRLCPHFVSHHFTPALKTQLKQQGIARTLYDDTNLQALVNRCARPSTGSLTAATCISASVSAVLPAAASPWTDPGLSPMSSSAGRNRRRVHSRPGDCPPLAAPGRRTPHAGEQLFLAAVYAVENPDPIRDGHQQDRRLHLAISA